MITFTIAPPRSGKTTYVEKWRNETKNRVAVNADTIRLLLHGERFRADREKEVHTITEIMVKALHQQDKHVMVDETNTTVGSIRKWLRIDPEAEFIYLDTPKEECERRAYSSEQPDLVEKGVISRMFDNLSKLAKFGGSPDGEVTKENILRAVEKIRAEVLKEKENVVKT